MGAAVPCVGAHVGLVLADTAAHARYAAKLAELTYTHADAEAVDGLQAPGAHATSTPTTAAAATSASAASKKAAAIKSMAVSGLAKRMGARLPLLEQATEEAARVVNANDATNSAHTESAFSVPAGGWGYVHGRPPHEWQRTAAAYGPSETVTATTDESDRMDASPAPAMQLSGSFRFSGQKHFFLETHAAHAIPGEDGKMVVVSANQSPSTTQAAIAAVLGVPCHKVDVRVRRIGGAYGGKIEHHMPTAVVAALAAAKHRVPVRMHHERADDMAATGGRAPLDASWSCAFDETGNVTSCALKLNFESGAQDGAYGDLAMAIQWSDNCYHHDDFACSGGITSTPRPGNTACRAPGVLVSIPLHEAVLEAVAEKLGKHAEEVREINLYKAGQRTPAVCGGQVLGADGFNWTVPALWESAKAKWELDKRRAAIGDFNAKNRWRKRGIAMLPVKYGMSMSDCEPPPESDAPAERWL
eukprot:4543623-Pleurochrysis_carterae.AAC.1